jgi:CrcB protein
LIRFLCICAAGAAGTAVRYLLSSWLTRLAGPAFPWGTLAVNLIGSFLLGAIMEVVLATDLASPTVRLTLTTGLLGGFTTYSSFNYETVRFLQADNPTFAVLNIAATLLGCLTAGILGLWVGRLWLRS